MRGVVIEEGIIYWWVLDKVIVEVDFGTMTSMLDKVLYYCWYCNSTYDICVVF